ncbi:YitT family protein [Chitinibacter sp. GC72]|uniref:YitT family protein n=1 Tax=Chitinibacter sp. GC72 TaxID=1526917 RepID=UPI0012FBAF18|nr:YitT family protein [Chitinibacter sp. GC72]
MPKRHTWLEDAQGLLSGVLLMALAIQFFKQAGLLTGGVTGLAFLLHYTTHWAYGLIFFAISLPFYLFAYRVLGREFTLKTFACIAALSLLADLLPRWIGFARLDPLFASIIGGLLAGVGILMLIRHKASLGGVTVLALYLQQRFGWRAGHVQLGFDLAILACGAAMVSTQQLLYSVAGALALNLVIAINHRPGRYMGM